MKEPKQVKSSPSPPTWVINVFSYVCKYGLLLTATNIQQLSPLPSRRHEGRGLGLGDASEDVHCGGDAVDLTAAQEGVQEVVVDVDHSVLVGCCWSRWGIRTLIPHIGDVTIYINRVVLVSLKESVQVVPCLLKILLRSSFVLISAYVLDDVALAEVQ
jgi:hypothetical protein